MARIRTIKPEFWKHEGLCEQPEATHMLAAALINYADDYGYFNANPKLIAGEIYPLREPSVSIPESLRRLQAIGYIRLGTGVDGRAYGHIVEFEKHQRVSHPSDSKISCLSITWKDSGIIPETSVKSPETFRPEQGTGNGTGNREVEQPTRKRASKPPLAEPESFAEFWQVYPNSKARADALKAYRKAVEKSPPEPILAGAKRYAAEMSGEEKKFVKLAGGWLRDERWRDGEEGRVIRLSAFNSPEEQENQRKLMERLNGRQAQN